MKASRTLPRLVLWVMLSVSVRAAEFAVYDLHVSSSEPLAAYQVKVSDRNRSARIISVEGGEHKAFLQAPYFDPKAIQKNIIKLAAFSAEKAENLPSGRTRIASLHVETRADKQPDFEIVIEAAARPGGEKIKIEATISKREAK